MRQAVAALALALALVAAGCDGKERPAALVPAAGPPRTIRVAVDSLDDPSLVKSFEPTRIVRGAERVVAERWEFRLVVVRMAPYEAVLAFRRAEVDVAPVPAGDLQAALRDPALRGSVRVRPLALVDVVRLSPSIPAAVRRFLARSVPREEYVALVPEGAASPAGPPRRPGLRDLRRRAEALPRFRVRLEGGEEAELLAAFWREAGLDVVAVAHGGNARWERIPRPRARPSSTLIPIAGAASAQLVSRRLVGWRQDELGHVDYSRVRIRGG